MKVVEVQKIRAAHKLVPYEGMTPLQLTIEQAAIPAFHHTPGVGFCQKLRRMFWHPRPCPDKKRTGMTRGTLVIGEPPCNLRCPAGYVMCIDMNDVQTGTALLIPVQNPRSTFGKPNIPRAESPRRQRDLD